jgi:hypothetical protein
LRCAMAVKARKCDRPKQEIQQPQKVVCPVCGRRPQVVLNGKTVERGCEFLPRLTALKFDENKKKSDKIKSQRLREFHADICQNCKEPADECHAKKIARVKSRRARNAKKVGKEAYMTCFELKKLVDAEPCVAHSHYGYTPIPPDWYVPEEKL